MIKIIETCCIGKRSPELCEDGLYIGSDMVAVVDGATSHGEKKWDGKSAGAFAKQLIIERLDGMPPYLSGLEVITLLNGELRKAYSNYKWYIENPHERLAASVLIYNDHHKEIWSYGDCQYIVNGELYQMGKRVDMLFSGVRSFLLQHALHEGKEYEELLRNDFAREYIIPLIKKQTAFQNKDVEFGYPMLDGTVVESRFLKTQKVAEGSTIVLATDGYPILKESLAESEKELARLLKEDPLCIFDYKSTKGLAEGCSSFDDRTYVRLEI